uniref:Uncharacterized protein n=1 Tax=Arundo donax TaxID=35708 RepID=A0A0A9EKX9_ARUDO
MSNRLRGIMDDIISEEQSWRKDDMLHAISHIKVVIKRWADYDAACKPNVFLISLVI